MLWQWGLIGDLKTVSDTLSPAAFPQTIQQLLEKRESHVQEISKIDKTLADVMVALGAKPSAPVPAAVPAPAAKVVAAPVTKKAPDPKAKKRSRFSVSASDLVLAFVKSKKNPTTKEITQHLVSEGRSLGAVSNALSVLTTKKKLKRSPLGKGLMGSTYSLV
jgi:hypothetical protein